MLLIDRSRLDAVLRCELGIEVSSSALTPVAAIPDGEAHGATSWLVYALSLSLDLRHEIVRLSD